MGFVPWHLDLQCKNYGFLKKILNYAKLWIFWIVCLPVVFLVLIESSLQRGVRRLCFMAFRLMV